MPRSSLQFFYKPQRAMHVRNEFEVHIAEPDRDTTALGVHGEIDLVAAPRLGEAVLVAIEHRAGPVTVDLCEVPFMDSAGVHVLLDALDRLEAQGRALSIVCRERGQVQRVLALVGVLDAVVVPRSLRIPAAGGAAEVRGHATDRRARRHFGNDRRPPRSSPTIARVRRA